MNNITIDGFRRITKTEAKRRYCNGETIRLVPINFNPDNIWHYYADVNCGVYNIIAEGFETIIARKNDFETVVNAFTYYNCIDSETGRYPAFYKMEELK